MPNRYWRLIGDSGNTCVLYRTSHRNNEQNYIGYVKQQFFGHMDFD